jgi:hypothetical protein
MPDMDTPITLEEVLAHMRPTAPSGGSDDQAPLTPDQVQMSHPDLSANIGNKPFFTTAGDIGQSAKTGLLGGAASTTDLVSALGQYAPRPMGMTSSALEPAQSERPPLRWEKPFRNPETGKIDWSSLLPSYDTPVMDAAQRNFPETLGYQPTSGAGVLTKTTAEMAPGMLFPAGEVGGPLMKIGSRFFRNVAAPAVGTETAGAIAKKYYPEYEGAARFLGGMGAGMFAAGPEAVARSAIGRTASPGLDLTEAANYLKGRGITVPVSATHDLPALRAREGSTDLGVDTLGSTNIANQYNATIGADIGNPRINKFTLDTRDPATGRVVSEGTLTKQRKYLGSEYDRLSQGVDVPIDQGHVDDLARINAAWTKQNNLTNLRMPTELNEVSQILQFRNNFGVPLTATELRNMRTQLGDLARRSSDSVTATAAGKAVSVLDRALDDALTATGRPEVAAQFKDLNRNWRNLLATEIAVEKFSQPGAYRDVGLIDPRAMEAAATHMGLDATEPLHATARSLNNTQTASGAAREVVPTEMAHKGLKGLGVSDLVYSSLPTASYALLSGAPIGINSTAAMLAAAALAGSGAVRYARNKANQAGSYLLSTEAGQNLARRLAETKMNSPLPASAYAATNDNRMGRKSGGRVSSHDMAADQLVRAAERAKKGWGEETAPLLNQSDDAVAHALEVANRSI